jgi:hypothetical protein
VPLPLDEELLAWAAGFFDGEGSTIAKSSRRRPDYFQLDVSVPQCDHDGVPEVLVKFKRAMLGCGAIYPQHRDDLYKWSAGGRIVSEMALALMWPWLGAVKREQAQAAMALVDAQYAGGRRMLPARSRPIFAAHTPSRQSNAKRLDFAWVAGFIDAEGYFGLARRYGRKDGSTGFVLRASVTQHGAAGGPPEVLTKLVRVLDLGRIECHGEIDDFKWVAEGSVSVGHLLEEVRGWLGPVKTRQAETALETAISARARGDSERCKRGHLYDRVVIRANGSIHRICNSCARINHTAKRRAAGSKPRKLKNTPKDPTRTYAA